MRVKTSFSLRLRHRAGTPGTVDDRTCIPESDPELLFEPAANRYRQRLVVFVAVLFTGSCLAFLSLFVSAPFDKWVGLPGIACIFFSLVLFFTLPGLNCPSCGRATDSSFGQFSPACGHSPIQVSRLLGTRCAACARAMGSYKYRNYPIRYCTHCGTLLHTHGV